jgi:predicted transcriptional regulator|tara:strand:- start:29 stop:310 length:282 start_codon:yes stop_codon:yes gene_type:complete
MSQIEEITDEIEEEVDLVEEHLQFIINYKDMLEQSIESMTYKIQDRTEELKKIKDFLHENCDHNIEIDYIDSMKNGETMSQMIKYCKNCKLSL